MYWQHLFVGSFTQEGLGLKNSTVSALTGESERCAQSIVVPCRFMSRIRDAPFYCPLPVPIFNLLLEIFFSSYLHVPHRPTRSALRCQRRREARGTISLCDIRHPERSGLIYQSKESIMFNVTRTTTFFLSLIDYLHNLPTMLRIDITSPPSISEKLLSYGPANPSFYSYMIRRISHAVAVTGLELERERERERERSNGQRKRERGVRENYSLTRRPSRGAFA